MRYLLVLIFVVSFSACTNSEADQLKIENADLQEQLKQCQELTESETARANEAEDRAIKAQEEARLASERAQESAEMALEVIERVKNKK